MKQIVSWKVSSPSWTMGKIVEFYRLCQILKSDRYLCSKEITCDARDLSKLVSFMLTSKNQDILLIVEGKDAPVDQECIYRCLNLPKKVGSLLSVEASAFLCYKILTEIEWSNFIFLGNQKIFLYLSTMRVIQM